MGWWLLGVGAIACAMGVALIVFRVGISDHVSQYPLGNPKTPVASVALGIAFLLISAYLLVRGVFALL
jgi:hypothetical protein